MKGEAPKKRPKGGRSPKHKGTRAEREALARFREAGLEARRVPLSGAAPGFPGDLLVRLPGLGEVVAEVKARKRFGLEGWLEGRGLLLLRPDRKPPLVVLRLEDFLKVLNQKEER